MQRFVYATTLNNCPVKTALEAMMPYLTEFTAILPQSTAWEESLR